MSVHGRLTAAVLMIAIAMPSWAHETTQEALIEAVLHPGVTPPYHLGVGRLDGIMGDVRVDDVAGAPIAQAPGAPSRKASIRAGHHRPPLTTSSP